MSKHPLNVEIAGNVQAAMKARGVTQDALTIKTGIADRTLRRRLSGTSSWSTDELAAIATALSSDKPEVTVADLVSTSHAH